MLHAAPLPGPGEGRRPKLEVADIFRAYGEQFRRTHAFTLDQRRVMRDVEACRTAVLGGHLDVCDRCDFSRPSYNSCRNRHCPKCQGLEQARWIEARKARVLPVRHFHVVFTLPAELRPLAMANRVAVYDMLFEAAARTLLEFSADEKWIGGQPGLSAVLHTWSRTLTFHPHVHCVITDGGLTRDGDRWRRAKGKGKFLFPVKALSTVFRAKFVALLVAARERGKLVFAGGCAPLAADDAFAGLKKKLFSHQWVVYAKRPFGGAEHVFEYLGRYTHRVAISNHRLMRLDHDRVVFRTKDNKTVALHSLEFIRRFLLHVLPGGFVKIRHFGLYASGNVKGRLRRAHQLLSGDSPVFEPPGAEPALEEDKTNRELLLELTGIDLARCPRCRLGQLRELPLDSPGERPPRDPAPPPT